MAGKKSELVKMAELAKRSGVPAPTIKHYIREGLLPGPKLRTSPNVAFYDPRLAARIRVIKQLQADRFLPLRVIADLLEPAPSAAIRDAATTARGDKRRRRNLDLLLADVRRLGLSDVFPVALAEPYLAAVEKLCALEADIFRQRTPGSLSQAISLGERLIVGLRAKILPAMLADLGTNVGPR